MARTIGLFNLLTVSKQCYSRGPVLAKRQQITYRAIGGWAASSIVVPLRLLRLIVAMMVATATVPKRVGDVVQTWKKVQRLPEAHYRAVEHREYCGSTFATEHTHEKKPLYHK
jgi:hypothetical protein